MTMITEPPFLVGPRVQLAPLGEADISRDYLAWLNNTEVLRYRTPKAFPTTMRELKRWVYELPHRGDLVLRIRLRRGGRHIGNIALNSIQWIHGSAELAIMIGARDVWGRGFASEAIALVARHAFECMGLHRVWSESANPAFIRAVARLGWRKEGHKREALLVDGRHVDVECWATLAHEYQARSATTARSHSYSKSAPLETRGAQRKRR